MCIRVIDHWVWFTPSSVHSCHWPLCIGVIDHPIRRSKKAWVSAFVSLTNVHWCHWPSYEEKEKSQGVSIPFIDQCIFVSVTSSEHSCNRQVCIWHCKKCKYTIKEFFSTVFILHRGPSISSIKSSPVWYPNWFNSKFEFCTKLIQFNIQFKIILGKFNSKDYSNLDKSLLFNSIYYSIYNKLLWFNSKDYSN